MVIELSKYMLIRSNIAELVTYFKVLTHYTTHSHRQHTFKARTHRPILMGFVAESGVESADSIPESADSTTDFTIVGRLSISNMFNISTPTKSAD